MDASPWLVLEQLTSIRGPSSRVAICRGGAVAGGRPEVGTTIIESSGPIWARLNMGDVAGTEMPSAALPRCGQGGAADCIGRKPVGVGGGDLLQGRAEHGVDR